MPFHAPFSFSFWKRQERRASHAVPATPAPLITLRTDQFSEADLARIMKRGRTERDLAEGDWYAAVQQLIGEMIEEAEDDIADPTLADQNLRFAAGGVGNLRELAARMERHADAVVDSDE